MSNPKSITHISASGDRWDLLAWKYYGDATLFGPILMANPNVPIEPVLSAGTAIIVPFVQRTNVETADLPPWKKRGF